MAARFVALQNATEATDGKTNKEAHNLIKATLASMGEIIMLYIRTHAPPRNRVLTVMTAILDDMPVGQENNRMTSNVFVTNFLCGNIKRILGLKYSTYMTLGNLYGYVRRFNRWFREHKFNEEFQLVQQKDLEILLGYEGEDAPKFTVYNPCDIRHFFNNKVGC
jgi:hypothetical protein